MTGLGNPPIRRQHVCCRPPFELTCDANFRSVIVNMLERDSAFRNSLGFTSMFGDGIMHVLLRLRRPDCTVLLRLRATVQAFGV